MNITKHARTRSQQRGISEEIIMLLLLLGEPTMKPGNVMELKITNRTIQSFDRAKKKAILIDGDDIITAYNLINKMQRRTLYGPIQPVNPAQPQLKGRARALPSIFSMPNPSSKQGKQSKHLCFLLAIYFSYLLSAQSKFSCCYVHMCRKI